MNDHYLGIDLGGTNLRVALRTPDRATTTGPVQTAPVDPSWTAGTLLDRIADLAALLPLDSSEPSPAGVGIAATGDVDPVTGVCVTMPRFRRLEGVPLAALARERFGAPSYLLNDGITAALAELRAGAGRGLRDYVMITLGTGIGCGVVLGGKVLAGERGRIGKAGHQILDVNGPVHCHCGLPGCWQSLAGKQAVIARAEAWAARSPSSRLAAAVAREGVDLEAVTELAEAGDGAARAVLGETGRYVGIGLANLVKLFAPERVLIGGGIAEGSAILLASVREALTRYAVKPYQRVEIEAAALGHRAGVIGATYLAEEGPPTG